MNSNRAIGRVVFWNFRKTARTMILLALSAFLLLYGYVRWTGNLQELFTVYLGGFQRFSYLAILWLLVHLPIEGFLYSSLMDALNKSYHIKILKYRSKIRYLNASLLTLILQILTYYITGYVLVLILMDFADMRLILWQAGLACLESLNIVLTAFLLGVVYPKCENVAFSAVVVIELANCFLCGGRNGIFRFLPFTQAKMQLQKEYFDNGIALAVSLITLCIILVFAMIIWVRKDERSQ